MTKKYFIIFISFVWIFFACSSSEETTTDEQNESQPEIYVFDDVTEPVDSTSDEVEPENPPVIEEYTTKYFVQVGAFTSKNRADKFVKDNSSKTQYNLEITYSEDVKLFVVRLPAFKSKEEAEKVRNKFWKSGQFNDAFIVTK